MTGFAPRPTRSDPCGPLRGTVRVIGDKSLTHRALIFAALGRGQSRIGRANLGDDCSATARALSAMGAGIQRIGDSWEVEGCNGRLSEPDDVLDLGNSGTGIRLLCGLVAGQGIFAVLTGDASLRKRPMRRIADPLSRMGTRILLRTDGTPPIAVHGGGLAAIEYAIPVASAQIKSCLLLAALGLEGGRMVIDEPAESRDHTERFLRWLGEPVISTGSRVEWTAPVNRIPSFSIDVPGDTSAAMFYLVAACLVPGSEVEVEGVLLNPTRTGAIEILREMGAAIDVDPADKEGPEPVGRVRARASSLHGCRVPAERLVRALDEVPILAVAAAAAKGETRFEGAAELRVKESDRIEGTAQMVRNLGAEAETGPDWLRIVGRNGVLDGRVITSHGDHRIAMSGIVAGCHSRAGLVVDDVRMIGTSDPFFLSEFARLGANIT